MRDALGNFEQCDNTESMVHMTIAALDIENRSKTKGMAPKNIRIEKSQVQFEDEYLKQKTEAMVRKKLDSERYDQIIADRRLESLNKMRTNYDYMKEWDQVHEQKWRDTMNETKRLQGERANLEQFLTNRIHGNEVRIREEGNKEAMELGINKFESNALRLGINLHKNPDNVETKQKDSFNAVASMQKIRNRVSIAEKARVEREKRQRKLRIDQAKAQEVYTEIKEEKDLLARFKGMSDGYVLKGYNSMMRELTTEIYNKNRRDHANSIQKDKSKNAQQIADALGTTTREDYFETKKNAELNLREFQLKERMERYDKHYEICFNILEYMNDMSEQCYDKMGGSITDQIDTHFWRELQEKFIEFESLTVDKDQNMFNEKKITMMASSKMHKSDAVIKMAKNFNKYISCLGSLSGPYRYGIFLEKPKEEPRTDFLAESIRDIIDQKYPIMPIASYPTKLVNHLPLRINIVGKNFSGRKTLAKHLKNAFGLEIIVLDDIIKEAEAVNKEEDSGNDPKTATKNTRLKALARKRDMKKSYAKIPGTQNDIEDTSAQLLEFKAIGEKISMLKQEGEDIPDSMIVSLIVKKLSCQFPHSSKREIVEKYCNEVEARKERPISAEKDMQAQAQPKKPDPKSKTAKKGETTKVEEEQKSLLDMNKYFYTSGFVLIGFPLNANQARMFDESMTGFVPQKERLNPQAEEKKVVARRLLDISQWEPEVQAFPSFDLVCYLESDAEECRKKANNRKCDPQTGEIYHMELYPPPEQDKKLLDRLENIQVDQEEQEKNQAYVDNNLNGLEKWYGQFGQQKVDNETLFKPFCKLADEKQESNNNPEVVSETQEQEVIMVKDVQTQLAEKFGEILDLKYEKYQQMNDKDELVSILDGAIGSQNSIHDMGATTRKHEHDSTNRRRKKSNSPSQKVDSSPFNVNSEPKAFVEESNSKQENHVKKKSNFGEMAEERNTVSKGESSKGEDLNVPNTVTPKLKKGNGSMTQQNDTPRHTEEMGRSGRFGNNLGLSKRAISAKSICHMTQQEKYFFCDKNLDQSRNVQYFGKVLQTVM